MKRNSKIVAGSAAALSATAAFLAWAARGPSSSAFGPNVWRGPRARRAIALTFDDGPSESTPELLDLLARHDARATFFQCGANVRRLPHVARQVAQAGHEIGNHTDTHQPLYLKNPYIIYTEFSRAQKAIHEITGVTPTLLRAPYGVRWFGFRIMQQRLNLTGVMWTAIGSDWRLDSSGILQRLRPAVQPGAILCLHDGRELRPQPDIRNTIDSVKQLLEYGSGEGFQFLTVSELLCPTTPLNASAK